jgi:hypothetical protein
MPAFRTVPGAYRGAIGGTSQLRPAGHLLRRRAARLLQQRRFMKHLAMSVLLAACATAPAYQRARDLPRVDHFGAHLVENGVDELTARLRVCAEPDGHSQVQLLASSGVSYFDYAVVQDVAEWDYPALATGMCKAFKVRYLPASRSL